MNKLDIGSRRGFLQRLALPVGGLLLGGGLPAWAKKKERKEEDSKEPHSSKVKCHTKVLWDFDGCVEDRFMGRVTAHLYKGHVYTWVLLPGFKTMIVKVPLNGGPAEMHPLMPGHVTGSDPHRYYRIAADSEGFIHVCGDMHSSAFVKHWVSKRPEDISEFVFTSTQGEDKRPQGETVTYPRFERSPEGVLYYITRCAKPVWGIGVSVLDVKTQTWTILGADVPASELPQKRDRKAKGNPMTAWEDNGEGGNFAYTQPHGRIIWDKNGRMHFTVGILNANTPSAQGGHTGSDILYAYSDDGGKSFHRGDGSLIQLPMRAEPGPYQADVVYSRHEGPPPWVGLMSKIHINDKNQPVITAKDHKTGWHEMVLENGKWKEVATWKGTAKDAPEEDEDEEDDELGLRELDLPYRPSSVVPESLHEAGGWVYTTFPEKDPTSHKRPKYHRMLLVMSTPLVKGAPSKP